MTTPTQLEVAHISPDAIKIDEWRFRDDVGNIQELADSINEHGLMAPVVLDDDNRLIAGFRRLSAMKLLKWPLIPYVSKGTLPLLKRRELELEENIRRKQMHFMEEQKAIVEIHRLKQAENPGWSAANTAQVIGKTERGPAVVSEAKLLVEAAELFPEIKKAKSKKQALSWARSEAKKVGRTIDVAENLAKGEPVLVSLRDKIVHGDSVEVIKTLPDGSFDAIITDPPFGIDYDTRKEGSESQVTSYEDSANSYMRLLGMADDLYRVLKPDGWLVWFFGMSWYGDRIDNPPYTAEELANFSLAAGNGQLPGWKAAEILSRLGDWRASYIPGVKTVFRNAGFIVDELPIVWDRSEGKTYTTRPDRYFNRAYDVALHCIKGNPEIVQRGKNNIIRVAPVSVSDRDATVERPPGLYVELINRLTVKGERVADFFSGSGAVTVACLQTNRDFFAVEADVNRHALSISRAAANMGKAK